MALNYALWYLVKRYLMLWHLYKAEVKAEVSEYHFDYWLWFLWLWLNLTPAADARSGLIHFSGLCCEWVWWVMSDSCKKILTMLLKLNKTGERKEAESGSGTCSIKSAVFCRIWTSAGDPTHIIIVYHVLCLLERPWTTQVQCKNIHKTKEEIKCTIVMHDKHRAKQ